MQPRYGMQGSGSVSESLNGGGGEQQYRERKKKLWIQKWLYRKQSRERGGDNDDGVPD